MSDYDDKSERKEPGCPCGTRGSCCDSPDVYTPTHVCCGEGVCEDCYQLHCENCGASCWCEL